MATRCAADIDLVEAQTQIPQQGRGCFFELVDRTKRIVPGKLFGADFQDKGGRGIDGWRHRRGRDNNLSLRHILEARIAQRLALLDKRFGHLVGETAHTAKISGPFGDADGPTRIEDVKGVRAFENVVMGRNDQALGQAALGFLFVEIVTLD